MTSPDPTKAALIVAVSTPVAMIASRGIAPVMLAVVTVLLVLAAWRAGRSRDAVTALRDLVSSPLAPWALAFVGLLALSLVWTPVPERGAAHVAQVAGSLLLLAFAAANLRVLDATPSPAALVVALLLTAALLVADMWSAGGLRDAVGLATEPFRLNRAAVAAALLLPLVAHLLLVGRNRFGAFAVWIAVSVAIFTTHSASAQLATLVVSVTFALALRYPVFTSRFVAATAVAATAAIPFVAPHVNPLVPAAVHEAVGYGTLTIRGEIWTAFAALAAERPLFGWGVEASHAAASFPILAGATPAEIARLDWGHPHNAALQIWFELGGVGAVLACALLVVLSRTIERTAGRSLPAAVSTFAGAYAVAFVSHGAWQAWYWCLVAVVVVLFVAWARRGAPGEARADLRQR